MNVPHYGIRASAGALAAFAAAAFSPALHGADYAIDASSGVPLLCADGKPERPRMFYGNVPGIRYQKTTPELSDISAAFLSNSADNFAVQLATRNPVGEIWISSVLLEDTFEGTEKSLLRLSAETAQEAIACLEPRFRQKYSCSVEKIGDSFMLHIKADPQKGGIDELIFSFGTKSALMKPSKKYKVAFRLKSDVEGRFGVLVFSRNPKKYLSEGTFKPQQKYAAAVGVRLFTMPGGCISESGDATTIDAIYNPVVKTCPSAAIIPRIGFETSAFMQSHPDHMSRDAFGKLIVREYDGSSYISLSSEEFRAYSAESARQYINYVEEHYGDNVAGYHFCGGNSGEWFYGGSPQKELGGYDAPTVKAWRKWLRAKYSSIDALKSAWRADAGKSFDDIAVPTPKERRQDTSFLLDPQKNASVIDFNVFLQDEMTDAILSLAKAAKETLKGKKRLVLFFYGYSYELSSAFNGPAVTGHFALRKILNSPYIDVLSGPISYYQRGLGSVRSAMSPADSVALAGKMWLDEDDNRTYLMWDSGSPVLVPDANQRTREDSIAVMRRNLSQQILCNRGSWWMDLFGCGWFNDPQLWKQIGLLEKTERDFLQTPSPYSPEVALIHDDLSMCYVGGNGTSNYTTKLLMYRTRAEIGRAGVPFGQYLCDDVLEGKTSAKLNVFLAVFALDETQRKKMRETAKKSACLFAWTTGYIDLTAKKFSLAAVEEATGFKVQYAGDVTAELKITPEGERAGLKKFGSSKEITPLLSPILESGDAVLAEYQNGLPAVVVRRSGKFPQIFMGATEIPVELYRYAADIAGVHIYTRQPATVFANGAYVSVSATEAGAYKIDIPSNGDVYDAIENVKIGRAPTLELDMKMGETKLLKIEREK